LRPKESKLSRAAQARASGCTAYQSLNLSKAGWSLGYVSAIDSEGRTIWIADAHRGDGKRSSAMLLKKERERHCHPTARARPLEAILY